MQRTVDKLLTKRQTLTEELKCRERSSLNSILPLSPFTPLDGGNWLDSSPEAEGDDHTLRLQGKDKQTQVSYPQDPKDQNPEEQQTQSYPPIEVRVALDKLPTIQATPADTKGSQALLNRLNLNMTSQEDSKFTCNLKCGR